MEFIRTAETALQDVYVHMEVRATLQDMVHDIEMWHAVNIQRKLEWDLKCTLLEVKAERPEVQPVSLHAQAADRFGAPAAPQDTLQDTVRIKAAELRRRYLKDVERIDQELEYGRG